MPSAAPPEHDRTVQSEVADRELLDAFSGPAETLVALLQRFYTGAARQAAAGSPQRKGLQTAPETTVYRHRGREASGCLRPTKQGLPAAAETVLLTRTGRETGSSLQPTKQGTLDSCRDSDVDTQGQQDRQQPEGAHKSRAAGTCRDSVAETKGQGDRQQPAAHKDRHCRQLQRQPCWHAGAARHAAACRPQKKGCRQLQRQRC